MKNMNGKQAEMKKALIFAAIAMLGFASCTKELMDPSKGDGGKGTSLTFSAIQQSFGTKAEIGETVSGITSINWQASDRLSVFDKDGNNNEFAAAGFNPANPTECDFEGTVATQSEDYTAIYPYNAGASISGTTISGICLPSNQKAVAGSFDPAAALMAAKTEGGARQLAFKNLVGYVKLTPAFDFKKIVLSAGSGDALAGAGSIDYSGSKPVFSIAPETKLSEITLSDEENTLSGEQAYYIAVPAGTLAAGWSISITAADGKVYVREAGKEITFKKNVIINLGELNTSNMEEVNYLTFSSTETQNFSLNSNNWTGSTDFWYKLGSSEWTQITFGQAIEFGGAKGKLKLRGQSIIGTAVDPSSFLNVTFSGTSPVECKGDIRTLVDYTDYLNANTENARFVGLFLNCSSLATAPELPSTTLTQGSYYGMFLGCTSLTEAPELPAITLAQNCYEMMFSGCTSLTEAPELPAATLTQRCYASMFSGCIALTEAPELPAATLTPYCYVSMFSGCTALSKVSIAATDIADISALGGWLEGTTPGTIYCTPEFKTCMESDPYLTQFLYGWTLANGDVTPYLTFSSTGDQTFTLKNNNGFTLGSGEKFEYKVGDGDWSPLNFDTPVEFGGSKGKLKLRGNSSKGTSSFDAEGYRQYCAVTFSGTSPVESTGDIRTLVDYENYSAAITGNARFMNLFEDCTVLTSAPELPATSLADNCYSFMFSGCSALTSAPSLPAKTLAEYCYRCMFSGCAALATAPSLPAKTLATECYLAMFEDCTALTTAPLLPATTLADGFYSSMFYGCSALTAAPELAAPALVSMCYSKMFCYCTSLTEIHLGATSGFEMLGQEGLHPLDGWLDRTSSGGIVYCTQELLDAAVAKPSIEGYVATHYDWTIAKGDFTPYLTFSSEGPQNFTFYKESFTLESGEKFEYKVGSGAWSALEFNTAIEFGGAKGTLKLRGNSSKGTASIDGDDWYWCTVKFSDSSVPVGCSGDIRTLVDYENYSTASTAGARFISLFEDCTNLTSAPDLPATILASDCYSYMFSGCTSLKTAPSLPGETLADYCYSYMFSGCSALETAPALPAITLAQGCYSSMFWRCTALTVAPSLPAETLADYCYQNMFCGCSALENAPELPAKNMTLFCYYRMFYDCKSLQIAPSLPAETLADNCYLRMFSGCSALETAPALPAMTLANSCYKEMFYNCTSLQAAPSLPATTLAPYCYDSMFSGCKSLSTAPETLPALELKDYCYQKMFQNCAFLKAPELPATTLAKGCYNAMFSVCTNMVSGPSVLPAKELLTDCYRFMFELCSKLTVIDIKATTNISSGLSGMLAYTADGTTGTINCTQEFKDAVTSNTSLVPSNWSTNVKY